MKGQASRLWLGLLLLAVLIRLPLAAALLNLSTLQAIRGTFRAQSPPERAAALQNSIGLAEQSNHWAATYQAGLAIGRTRLWFGDYAGAESALQAALAREHAGLLAKVFLAFTYSGTDRPAAALDLWVQVHGADYFRLRGDNANAAEVYEREVAAGTFNVNDYVGLAEVYSHLGRWAAARDTYQRGIARYPSTLQFYEALAQVDFWQLGDLNGAVDATQEAIKRTPPAYRYNQYLSLGHMYRLTGQPAAAEVWYHAAINLDAARKDAHIGLAYILIDSGRMDQAANEVTLALRADPADPVAQELLAKIRGQ